MKQILAEGATILGIVLLTSTTRDRVRVVAVAVVVVVKVLSE